MKPFVLLVDDDIVPMEYYIMALKEEGFEVEQVRDPDATLEFVRKNVSIAAIVLDIMMPPGNIYRLQDTHQGLNTGFVLYNDLKCLCPNVPVIILTNVNPLALEQFQQDPRLKVVQKLDYPPFELAQLVSKVVKDASDKSSN